MLKRVRLVEIDDRTSTAAPPVLLRLSGHDVEERSCVTRQGRRVAIPLGSAHLGLCDVDFPDHRAKPHDDNNDLTRTRDFIREL